MAEQTESTTAKPQPRWAAPVVVGSIVVLGLAVVVGVLFPKTRKIVAAGVIVSPIPPLP